MSNQKERYYWTQLRRVLAEGQWSSTYPAKTPNGIALTWSELLRKFNKHCKGFHDVAEVASQTHALALLLSANSTDDDQDDPPESGVYPLDIASECSLPEERIEEATAGYEVLKGLKSSNFDTLNFALAYYAYALGNPTQCLSHLSNVPDVLHLQNHIPSESEGSTRSNKTGLLVPSFGTGSSLSSAGGSFASLVDSSAPEIKDGRGWAMTETFRSLCLQGMSHEKLSSSDPHKALRSYGTALPLLSIVISEIAPNSAPTGPGKINLVSFNQYHELWRWIERLIWRAVSVSSRMGSIHVDGSVSGDPNSVWTWLSHYNACSVFWPANFRTNHRSTISALYLRAIIMRYGHPSGSVPTESEKPPSWLHIARSVVNDYRAVLSVSTTFPRAGDRNVKVEDFVDLCVGVWEASGAVGDHAGWVIDVLWWATRLTFNSYRILRHMSRLLYASGDTSLARRTLLLYVQVVGKAWQANSEVLSEDTDENQRWVETLVSGARMLCRSAVSLPGTEGIDEARDAWTCIEKARTRLDKNNARLCASTVLAEGIWNSVMVLKEQNPRTRSKRLADAHALFVRAVETFPTPSGYFHLALSFARPSPAQDLSQAINNAGLAVEGDVNEIRYWHLLGLLLAATEQWKAAGEILERGAELGEALGDGVEGSTTEHESQETDNETLKIPVPVMANGRGEVHTKDFVRSPTIPNGSTASVDTISNSNFSQRSRGDDTTPSGLRSSSLLDPDATQIPESSTLLMPVLDHIPSSKRDVFEYALQLRMSQGVLTEVVEGAEGGELKWLEIFSWVAEKKGAGNDPTPRPSVDGGRHSAEKDPSFVISPPSEQTSPIIRPSDPVEFSEKAPQETLQAIPITISPATPETEIPPQRASSEKKRNGGLRVKRSSSIDRDTSKSKKVQQMLKNRVHKGQVRITTISRKIGNGVVRNGSLKRSNSTPDFHSILRQTSYQASSIHSRRRLSSIIHPNDRTPTDSPPPPPTVTPPQEKKRNTRLERSNRLIADLWLMSAATFRRLGKIEQARGSIQEAEVRDVGNPAVWVQLGLYYVALGREQHAMDAFQKALFIDPDDVSATVHLARLHLSAQGGEDAAAKSRPCSIETDLAAGMLSHLTRGNGWDVPEAWYFLAKAYGVQGRKERERECLDYALELSVTRGIRELGAAVGWCI